MAQGSWGNVSYLKLSNNCLDPAAQFRFVGTSAILNLKRPGCLHPLYVNRRVDLFLLWVASVSEKGNSCNSKLAINQTVWGGLSTKHWNRNYETWCAVPKSQPLDDKGKDPYFGLTVDCNDTEIKHFNFGKFLVSL